MRTAKINSPGQQSLCVFPTERLHLPKAVAELGLAGSYPVIVLIGGEVDKMQMDPTQQAIETISQTAEEMNAIVISGGTDMGIMAEVGRIRAQRGYKFPLVGIAPETLVTWSGGPHSAKFLWWGEQRWQLEPHYSHFILVPGNQFGDESPWIADTASILSKGSRSVTILLNGGEVSRKDIDLSLEKGRPVIALSRSGRLADELARQPVRSSLITIIPVHSLQRVGEAIHAALSLQEDKLVGV